MLIAPVRVCFVCSGNICRSPTAEVVLTTMVRDAGLEDVLVVDSAGTGDWHAGDDMDDRSRVTMTDAGYAVAPHVAKQFTAADFESRDLVVALDAGHRRALSWLAEDAADPAAARAKIVLLRDFDPELAPGEDPDVADPYYGGPDGFTEVLAQIRRSCTRLLAAIQDALESGDDLLRPDRPATGGSSGARQRP